MASGFKALFGAFVAFGVILILLVGSWQSEGNKTKIIFATQLSSTTSLEKLDQEHVKVSSSSSSSIVHPELDLNYMSKRGVPNGPDPIHNRRAGNSKRPPGQA